MSKPVHPLKQEINNSFSKSFVPEDKTKIDYFRVVTGIGYGNDASTGIIKIDLNNKNFSKLESILNGDDTVTLSYQPDEDFLEDDLKNLQKALIDACVARKNEENSSESN